MGEGLIDYYLNNAIYGYWDSFKKIFKLEFKSPLAYINFINGGLL